MQGLPTPGRLTDPQGRKDGWQHAKGEQGDRDLAFFDAVLKKFFEEYGIDEDRIYSTGHSNGGGFTYLLWATHPDLFAAIAPSAAGGRAIRREKPAPLPVIHFAGRNDPLVVCLHDRQHQYPDFAPKLTVRFFKQHQRTSTN